MSSSTQDASITLYDIPRPGHDRMNNAWSPNVWKARYALNIKGIAYKTVWVEHPDIAGLAKKIGAAPTGIDGDGNAKYTAPFIHDSQTGAVISESFAIVRYLDETYPSALPRLVPEGTTALQGMLSESLYSRFAADALPAINAKTAILLGPRGEQFYRRTRLPLYGNKSLEDFCPPGPAQDAQWKRAEALFEDIARWIDAEASGPFFAGKQVTFVDLQVEAWLRFIQRTADDHRWAQVTKWQDGRWAKYMELFSEWEQVDEGVMFSA